MLFVSGCACAYDSCTLLFVGSFVIRFRLWLDKVIKLDDSQNLVFYRFYFIVIIYKLLNTEIIT